MVDALSNDLSEITIENDKNFNRVVKIDNKLLESDFPTFTKGWTSFDLDWWNIVDAQAIDKDTNLIKIPIMQMKELLQVRKHMSQKEFVKKSNESFKKFLTIQVGIEQQQENGKMIFMNSNLFDQSYIDTDLNAWIKVQKGSVQFFNNLSQWTRFALEQSTRLHTTYSKMLFMYLKQWRTVGKRTFSIEEFREKLSVPKSYKPGSIDQKILNPTAEILAPYFFNFRITKNYAKGQRGRKLIGYTFSFKPETKNQKEIGYSKAVEETTRIYSIMSNDFLTMDQKFHAVDRYRNLKLGTTKRYYQKAHPQTYFLDPEDGKRSKRSILHRTDLGSLLGYSITTLEKLCESYENLLHRGNLKEWDLQDLHIIELNLFKKQVDLYQQTRMSDKPYLPQKRLIATRVFNEILDGIKMQDYSSEGAEREIERQIRQEFGLFAQQEDNRPMELKLDF